MTKEQLVKKFLIQIKNFCDAIERDKDDYELCNMYIHYFYNRLDDYIQQYKEIESEE